MESNQSELKFYKIDPFAGNEELLLRIKEILTEGGSHNAERFNENIWKWQYNNLPMHDACIYVCNYDNKITGYYHVPVYEGLINGASKKFAMVQDVAVSNSMRGKGVFKQLAEFATSDLKNSGIDIIYTFPNQKSIHTFLKYNGYKIVNTFDTFILPFKSSALIRAKINLPLIPEIAGFLTDTYSLAGNLNLESGCIVQLKETFDDKIVALFQNFNAAFAFHLLRNKTYMTWRFFEKPGQKHFLFTLEKQDCICATAIIKIDEMLKVRSAILLDFAFTDEKYLIQLLHNIRKRHQQFFGEKLAMLFTAFNCQQFLKNKKFGFIKIPEKINPRPLHMLALNANESSETIYQKENWLATLADWDVL